MIRPIQILNDLIASTAHTLKVSQVVDNGDGTYTLDVNFTYYLNSQRTITINSVSYRVQSFVLNESITIKGDSLPVTTSFDIDSPRFLHGTPKKVNGEMINENTKDYPFIWLLEFMEKDYDDDFNSAISVVLDLNLFFLTDVYEANWDISTHTTEATDTMSNEIEFFIKTVKKRRDLFGEITAHAVTDHVNFGEYITNKGYDSKILSDNLSGSQLKMSLPYVVDVCIGDLPIVSKCFAATDVIKTSEGVTLYTNVIPSGGANNQVIQDGINILNGSLIAGILAEGTKAITLKDTGGATVNPTVLVNTKTNLDLEVAAGATERIYIRAQDDGQTTIYNIYDSAWNKINRPDPYTPPVQGIPMLLDPNDHLLTIPNNIFGHRFKETGLTGGYHDHLTNDFKDVNGTVTTKDLAFPDNYVIDNHSGYGWINEEVAPASLWADMLDDIEVFSMAGFSDYHAPSSSELVQLVQWANPQNFQTRPTWASFGGIFLFTSTTHKALTLRAYTIDTSSISNVRIKLTQGAFGIAKRYHFT